MRIPGWRAMPPEDVGLLIEDRLRSRDTSSVTIIRRLRPGLHGAAVAATLPLLGYQIVGSLTILERAVGRSDWDLAGLQMESLGQDVSSR